MNDRRPGEAFYEASARILSYLWEAHPEPCSLSKHGLPKAFSDLSPEDLKVYFHTVAWLANEGFIRVDTETVGVDGYGKPLVVMRARACTLTSTGLALLGQEIQDGVSKRSRGDKLVEALKEEGKGIAIELIKTLLVEGGKRALGLP